MTWFFPSSRGSPSGGGLIGGGRITWRSIWTHFGGERQGVGRMTGVGVVLIQLTRTCSRKDPFNSRLGTSQSLRWLLPFLSGFRSSPSLSGSVFTALPFWWARQSSVFWISWLSCLLSSLLNSLLGRRGLRLVFRWLLNCVSTPESLLGPAWVRPPCDWSPSHAVEILCTSFPFSSRLLFFFVISSSSSSSSSSPSSSSEGTKLKALLSNSCLLSSSYSSSSSISVFNCPRTVEVERSSGFERFFCGLKRGSQLGMLRRSYRPIITFYDSIGTHYTWTISRIDRNLMTSTREDVHYARGHKWFGAAVMSLPVWKCYDVFEKQWKMSYLHCVFIMMI